MSATSKSANKETASWRGRVISDFIRSPGPLCTLADLGGGAFITLSLAQYRSLKRSLQADVIDYQAIDEDVIDGHDRSQAAFPSKRKRIAGRRTASQRRPT